MNCYEFIFYINWRLKKFNYKNNIDGISEGFIARWTYIVCSYLRMLRV